MKNLLLLLLVTLLYSCKKQIEITLPLIDVKPVVNCLFTDNDAFSLHLSLPKQADDTASYYIENANVFIMQNEKVISNLQYTGNGFYNDSLLHLDLKKSYSLKINTNEYQEVYAASSIPQFGLELISANVVINAGKDEEGFDYSECNIRIRDLNPGLNYSGVAIQKESERGFYFYPITSSDPIFISEMVVSDYPEILVFNDELFNDSEVSFKIKFHGSKVAQLILFTLSESAYRYLKTLVIHDYTKEYDFWEAYEPIPMYSNIENGYGIFAGYSSKAYEISKN